MITSVNRRVNKHGAIWAQVTLEDLTTGIEVTVFPRVYERVSGILEPDNIVAIEGVVEAGEDRGRMRAQNVTAPHVNSDGAVGPVIITMAETRCTPKLVADLKRVISSYPGTAEVHVEVKGKARTTVFRLSDGFHVQLSSPLFADLKALLGPTSVRMAH